MSHCEMTIEELDLSVRAYNCLKRARIDSVSELVSRMSGKFGSMFEIRNLGRKSLEEILTKLFELGFPADEWLNTYIESSDEIPNDWIEFYRLLTQKKNNTEDVDRAENTDSSMEIPRTFTHKEFDDPYDEETDWEHKRVLEYLRHFSWGDIHFEINSKREKFQRECYVEKGYIYRGDQTADVFAGDSVNCVSSISIYPFNLLTEIGASKCYSALFVDLFSNSVVEQMDGVFSTLAPIEERLLRCCYQYGYTSEEVLKVAGLPTWSTLQWGIEKLMQKGLRKLRHPARRRHFRGWCDLQWYVINSMRKEQYCGFVNDVVARATEKANAGCSIREAFCDYYNEDIIAELETQKSIYSRMKPIPVSNLGLTWELYAPLKQAGIETLADILDKHGRSILLKDRSHSGLRHVFGLHEDGIGCLLSIVEQHTGEEFDPRYTREAVQYAESLACGTENESIEASEVYPDIACTALPPIVFDFLLRHGYRKKTDVFRDFENGKMQEKYDVLSEKEFTWEQLKTSIIQLGAEELPVWLIVSTDFWKKVLEQNSGASFNDIRKWYLSGEPFNTDCMELENHIAELFPIDNVAFRLLHRSRKRFLHWIWWPKELLRKCGLPVEENDTAYWGGETYEDKSYLMIRKHNANGEQFALYSLNSSNEALLSIIEEKNIDFQILANIYNTVCLNGEMFSDPAYGKNDTESSTVVESTKSKMAVRYEAAQKHFAKYFLERINDDLLRQELKSFEVISMDIAMWVLTNKTRIGLDTPIEELHLSVRAYNCLKRAEIRTINDLIRQTGDSLMKVRNCGKKSIDEVVYKLKELECPINIWGDE